MAAVGPKIAVHLYLNNPYGLISATVPNYTVNKVDTDRGGPTARETVSESPPFKRGEKVYDTKSPTSEPVSDYKVRKTLKEEAGFEKQLKPLQEKRNSPRTSPSGDKNASPPLVYYDKTTRQNHPSRAGSKNGSPLLGVTWSINVDRRDKVIIPRQPPPMSLLEKLGRLKSVEPVGVIKLRKETVSPQNYLIQRIQFAEKGNGLESDTISYKLSSQSN